MSIQNKNEVRPRSLNTRLITFIVLCWGVPIITFFTFVSMSYQEGIISKSEDMLESEVNRASEVIAIRINEAVLSSQKLSYIKDWEDNILNFQRGNINKNVYIKTADYIMKENFFSDASINLMAFYDADSTKPDVYSSRFGWRLSNYKDLINESVLEEINSTSNYAIVKVIHERIFIIRNLFTVNGFKPYGTLVLELNKNSMTKDVDKNIKENILLFINDTSSMISFHDSSIDEDKKDTIIPLISTYDTTIKNDVITYNGKELNGYFNQKSYENYHMGILYTVSRKEIYASLYSFYQIIIAMIFMFIPIIIYIVTFLKNQITVPIAKLVKASEEIENGNMGVIVEGESMPNTEFQYLSESFNSMSSQVKYLFDYVYDEKLAKKDAQILALQAQINPHFLNNTLEMMNWQARMSGDIIVSKMIEALGTVLNYRMNRTNVKEIYLIEELKCADAYLYIMSMRFGQRLQTEKNVDDSLLYLKVPPLILQPLIENAIVHGVETVKNGTIKVHIYHDDNLVYFKVSNSGKKLKSIELERINHLLNGNEDKLPKGHGKHSSIGIYNVNKRIKLVYGEEFGLSIYQKEENTISEIVIPYKKPKNINGDKERAKVETELKSLREMNNKS